jgi:hypothetical protein
MAAGTLTPLQLIAGASLLQNQGLIVSPELTASITAYEDTPLMQAFFAAAALDSTLETLAANSVPAFSNSLPAAYSSLGTQMTDVINAQATLDAGSGDVSKFIQAFNIATGYGQLTNQFINSAVNSQTYLANTFTSTNDSITGDITTVNLATPTFGQDLENLGNLINLSNLQVLGSPLALIQKIVNITGNLPVLSALLLVQGVPEEIILNLNRPTLSVANSVQRLMYQAMTQVTGSDLDQVLKVLKVTTANISTMADLLNPVKLFPNSFQSLTVTTSAGIRAIYTNSSGSVNYNLETELPAYIIDRYNDLKQIIPADQALANCALGVSLGQINGISSTTLPVFSSVVKNMQTTRDLPLITALTTAVPESVANYYTSTLAIGAGPNGTVRVVDIIGLAGGWVATDAFLQTVEIFSTMNLTTLTTIYQRMTTAMSGGYGPVDSGPIVIPAGPGAGTYNGVPDPAPPDYNPTAISLAMAALTSAALTEIAALQTAYPTETSELNTLWNQMAQQVDGEETLQPIAGLNFADLTANQRTSIYGFVLSLTNFGTDTEEGGIAWFLEAMADLSTQGGQAVIACLREGRNQTALNSGGIYTNTKIPADPDPPPAQATLLPSEYSESEAINLVVK